MKRALTSLLISSICIAVYFFLFSGMKSGSSENEKVVITGNLQIVVPQVEPKSFINCIFNDAYESWNHQAWILKFLDRYKDSLHFNTIHYYNYPEVSNYYGSLNLLMTPTQVSHNIDMLDSVEARNLVTYVARQNIEKYCFGQRLIYEVSSNGSATINDGFCYQNVMANTYETDSGRTVLHAKPWPSANYNNAGYLCKSIYENLQHTDLYDFVQLDAGNWNLKPMMRIDSSIFSLSNTSPVIAVVAINYEGDVLDSIIVRVNNFRNDSNKYEGSYQDIFKFESNFDSLMTSGSPSIGLGSGRDNDFRLWVNNCKVDFKVYWFGQVEVWFDKMTVDDERANRMFNPTAQQIKIDTLIRQEAIELGSHSANLSFFVDEVTYSNYPCINYVDSILKTANSDSKIHTAITNYFHVRSFKNNDVGQSAYFRNANVNSFNADAHIFDLSTKLPNNFSYYDSRIPLSTISSNYEEYNSHLQAAAFGDRNSITPENQNVQGNDPQYWGSLVYQIVVCRKNRDLYSDAQFIMQPQIHSNAFKTNPQQYFQYGNREPTNEEIQAQTMLSIAHGAEGICWFLYPSIRSVYNSGTIKNYYQGNTEVDSTDTMFVYNYGLTELLQDNPTLPPRYSNMYGQDKWNYVKKMNIKIEHWKPTLDEVIFDSGHSVHSEGSNHSFISDIKSYYSLANPPFSSGPVYEDGVKFWEMGFFKPDFENPDVSTNDKSKYFFMVNRRCFPEIDSLGDFRQLKIRFNSSQLSGFKNWTIIDLDSNKVVRIFDKDSVIYVDMKIFHPGEGKLYKLAPVMQEGGTLIADEDCGGFEFECRGELNNNGYDIAIKPGTEIKFADPSARIIMSGGEFKSGLYDSPTAQVNLTATNGNSWKGLKFENCNSVELFNTEFTNVAPYPQDSTYAVEIVDCRHVNISGCKFYSELDLETGAVLMNFVSHTDPPIEPEVYLSGNLFKMDAGSIPAVSIVATGYYEIPALMEWNNFESYTGNSALAILLSNVTGGAIKENNFTGYDKTVFMLGSSIDFYGNSIIGSNQSSIGIVQHSASNANLSASGEMFTGGYNVITVEGQTAKCIQLANSYLLIDEGYNNFKLEDSATGNFHLEGTIPNDLGADPYPAEDNCFEIGYAQQVKHNLRWIDETPINLDAVPTNCIAERPENLIVFNLENGINDTIRFESGGSGGGERAIRNYELGIKNYENSISENLKESASNAEVVSVKALNDSVSINLRKRKYERVSALCREMLTDYADSINDASIISKLYLAELKQDTNQIRMSELKSYLESYILNNPEKEMMIRQAFYFIQKCKVSLGLYESAMTGFQQIINQFPYSYEGLLASWDYAATSLLNSQGGSGGGAISKNEPELMDEGVISYIDDPNDVYDSRKFSNDDRKTLNENLTKTFSSQVNKQTREIKSLEEKVTKNEATDGEKKKYQEMRTLKEIVKTRKPENVDMHISMISDDLSRIMKSTGSDVSDKYEANILPTEFALHQNYPNPFNPTTKISFEIPVDSKVKLVVYDLLGREVKKLVNNEFKVAGRYEYEFNASGLASGVYFYRLVAGSFVDTRRLVLLK